MNRLKNKVALITGGAAGIGLTTAKIFLKEGAKVVIVDSNKPELEKVIAALDHPNLSYCVADVSKANDVENYVNRTMEVHGKIDVFFNNAGIEGVSSSMAAYPDEIFDKVIAVNLKGVWLGCKHVIPMMSEGGSVIITSSVAGLKGFAGLGAYVTSKHAIVGVMRVAALEFSNKKIRVNTIHPGPVNTEMMRRIERDMSPQSPQEVMKGFKASVPFGRYAESQEIGELALFLASDESKYITGCTHVVDGGMLLS